MEYFAEAVAEGCHCEGDEEDSLLIGQLPFDQLKERKAAMPNHLARSELLLDDEFLELDSCQYLKHFEW